jgi:hypothetical protein
MLIKGGIDVNIKDTFFGQTALHGGLYQIKLKILKINKNILF